MFSPSIFKRLHLQSNTTHTKTKQKLNNSKKHIKTTEISQPEPERYLFFAEVRGLEILYVCCVCFSSSCYVLCMFVYVCCMFSPSIFKLLHLQSNTTHINT